MMRMAGGVGQRHHAAERRAQHDQTGDAQSVAECADVVTPLRQVPAFSRSILAAAVAAMVKINDLSDVGQGRVGWPIDRVIGAGPAVKQQQCLLFPHRGADGHKLAALDVEEQPYPVDEYMHGLAPCEFALDPVSQAACLFRKEYWTLGMKRAYRTPVTFLSYSLSQCVPLSMSRRFRRQAKMSSRFHGITCAAAISAMLAISSQAFAQSDGLDPEMRIQQLENQLRQLTGQNEELQYRNRQLEDRLRLLQGGAQIAPGGQPPVAQPSIAAAPPMQPNPAYRQPQPGYNQQIAAPAPIVQEPAGVPQAQGR